MSTRPESRPENASVPEPSRFGRWLVPLTAVVSLSVFVLWSWQPAYWLDEATTLFAVRRSWFELILLFRGDPSLVPYYLAIKPFALVSESEAWMRLPGEVAAAAAVTLLVAGVRRVIGVWPAALSGATLLAIPTISLYAQMVRPYAFLLLLVTACAVAWWQSLGARARRWPIAYGALFFGIGLANMYGLLVIVPFMAAAWFAPEGNRRASIVRTLVPALAAVACLAPYLVVAALLAPGPGRIRDLTPEGIGDTLWRAVGSPWLAAVLVAMALVGLIGARDGATPDRRRLMWLAAVWAFAIPTILVLAQVAGLRTLAPRYFVFTLPALALLAGLGLWRLARWWLPAGLVGLAAVVALGIPAQREYRSPDGHRAGSARAVAAAVQVPALANLPVVANPTLLVLSRLTAYAPDVVADRMPLFVDPAPTGKLMTFRLPPADEVAASLAPYPAVVLVRGAETAPGTLSAETDAALGSNGFTRQWMKCTIGGNTVSVLARPSRTGELASPEIVVDEIRRVAPNARCQIG